MKTPRYKHLQVGDDKTFQEAFVRVGVIKESKNPILSAQFKGLPVFENKGLPKNVAVLVDKGIVIQTFKL